MKGSQVPVILRRFVDKIPGTMPLQDTEESYSFVDVCYLNGIMNGEAVCPDVE